MQGLSPCWWQYPRDQ